MHQYRRTLAAEPAIPKAAVETRAMFMTSNGGQGHAGVATATGDDPREVESPASTR